MGDCSKAFTETGIGLYAERVPESRKRKKPKKSTPRVREPQAPVPGKYLPGTVHMPDTKLGGLLLNSELPPDLMIELLPATLWLNRLNGQRANICVDGAMTLHYAYRYLGIIAEPRAVDLVVSDSRTGRRTAYGQPDPYWTGSVFHGHCILWLPRSRRFMDATVEQYPEVRRYRIGPICGRSVATHGTAGQRAAIERGDLIPNSHFAVKREDLMLLYTVVGDEYRDVVINSDFVRETAEKYRRAGINLASLALLYMRDTGAEERTRRAPYPYLHALFDAIGPAEFNDDEAGDVWFTINDGDGGTRRLRLDDIVVPTESVPVQPRRRWYHSLGIGRGQT